MFSELNRYECICAFIDGYDNGARGGCLPGFRQWLLAEGDHWTNLPWWSIIRKYCFPDKPLTETLTDAESDQALEALAGYLERYLRCFQSGGLSLVLHQYNTWLIRQTDEATEKFRRLLE